MLGYVPSPRRFNAPAPYARPHSASASAPERSTTDAASAPATTAIWPSCGRPTASPTSQPASCGSRPRTRASTMYSSRSPPAPDTPARATQLSITPDGAGCATKHASGSATPRHRSRSPYELGGREAAVPGAEQLPPRVKPSTGVGRCRERPLLRRSRERPERPVRSFPQCAGWPESVAAAATRAGVRPVSLPAEHTKRFVCSSSRSRECRRGPGRSTTDLQQSHLPFPAFSRASLGCTKLACLQGFHDGERRTRTADTTIFSRAALAPEFASSADLQGFRRYRPL